MRLTKITTKSGDNGTTLLACNLVSKGHPAVDLLGDLDELNVLLGNIYGMENIQDNIFEVSAAIYKEQDWPDAERITQNISNSIEDINSTLPPLKEFIRPSGDIHLARTVARRCERKAWALNPEMKYPIYLNRLSDFLFVLARARKQDTNEHVWDRKNYLDNTKY